MPGKPDWGYSTSQGKNYPSKEMKAWDDGWRYRYADTAASNPITDNPFSAAIRPVEKQAWDDGWNSANDNSGGGRRMPNNPKGAPP